jgi:hypothetical protein
MANPRRREEGLRRGSSRSGGWAAPASPPHLSHDVFFFAFAGEKAGFAAAIAAIADVFMNVSSVFAKPKRQ